METPSPPEKTVPTSWPKRPVRWPLAAVLTTVAVLPLISVGAASYEWLRGGDSPWEWSSEMVGTYSRQSLLVDAGLSLLAPTLLSIVLLLLIVPLWRGKAMHGRLSSSMVGALGTAMFVGAVGALGLFFLKETDATPAVYFLLAGTLSLGVSIGLIFTAVGGWRRWGAAPFRKRSLLVLLAPVAAVVAGLVAVPVVAPLPDVPASSDRFAAASAELRSGKHAYTYSDPIQQRADGVKGSFDYTAKKFSQAAYATNYDYESPAVHGEGNQFEDSGFLIGPIAPWNILESLDAGGGTWTENTANGVTTFQGKGLNCDNYTTFKGWEDLSYRQKQGRVRWQSFTLTCEATVTLKGDTVDKVSWTFLDQDDERYSYTFGN